MNLALLGKFLSSRKWVFGLFGAVVAFGNAVGWWSLEPGKLYGFLAAVGLPIVGEGLADMNKAAAPKA